MPTADVNGITICYETAGPPDGPPMLLVMGLGAQMVAWPPYLIDALAAKGIRVTWYDNRDVGKSTWFDHVPAIGLAEIFGSLQSGAPLLPPYTLSDMAADGIGLLDHLDIDQAHVVGVSMGGMIVQRMALEHPDRVASMTSIMSTTGDPILPPPTPEATEALLTPAPVHDRTAYVESLLDKRKVLGSTTLAPDEEWQTTAIGQAFDRGLNPDGFLRQYHAILTDGDRTADLRTIDAPVLIIHGAVDPLIPVQAGQATADAIPGAQMEVIEGMGHDLPPAACERIVELLVPLLFD